MFRFQKVINEPDLLPVYFVRMLLQATNLIRKDRDKKLLAPEQQGVLQAVLFHVTFWHLNLGYFDRNPIESWPQNDVGIALWSLSVSANDWMRPDTLTRLCTVPTPAVLKAAADLGPFAMETRILRPLTWFGLMESRWREKAGLGEPRLYRKTPLFDRFLQFRVHVEKPAVRH